VAFSTVLTPCILVTHQFCNTSVYLCNTSVLQHIGVLIATLFCVVSEVSTKQAIQWTFIRPFSKNCRLGASLNNPLPEDLEFSLNCRTAIFTRHPHSNDLFFVLTLQHVHLYRYLYLALSGVTLYLNRQILPFTTNGALLPRDGAFLPL